MFENSPDLVDLLPSLMSVVKQQVSQWIQEKEQLPFRPETFTVECIKYVGADADHGLTLLEFSNITHRGEALGGIRSWFDSSSFIVGGCARVEVYALRDFSFCGLGRDTVTGTFGRGATQRGAKRSSFKVRSWCGADGTTGKINFPAYTTVSWSREGCRGIPSARLVETHVPLDVGGGCVGLDVGRSGRGVGVINRGVPVCGAMGD